MQGWQPGELRGSLARSDAPAITLFVCNLNWGGGHPTCCRLRENLVEGLHQQEIHPEHCDAGAYLRDEGAGGVRVSACRPCFAPPPLEFVMYLGTPPEDLPPLSSHPPPYQVQVDQKWGLSSWLDPAPPPDLPFRSSCQDPDRLLITTLITTQPGPCMFMCMCTLEC